VLYFVGQRTAVQAFDLLVRLRAERMGTTVPLKAPLNGRSVPTTAFLLPVTPRQYHKHVTGLLVRLCSA
jgi:hypothetical protein